ncbi:selenium metabolism-associated LysR family transcriptional regulator [Anaerostipes sp.]|uniref:selenium metabolism-associated LysR family transcriptional regulator n=1 Tax=Anaerostipes sp. TaxID=1872530 RepID=UPI0025BC7AC7|nr:selenium metabolism-associated LysR family transcriptional regulator [Anaerostipes sp.]MBS7009790.1 LysR family transcriptional regulator [Anaerostipes sp.]
MEFRQLEAFVNVVQYHSFSKAAKEMFLSQPTVSAHVVSLEQELSCRLFDRTTKMVEITEEGEKLYGYAKKLLDLRDEAYTEFVRSGEGKQSLVLAGDSIALQYVLPDILEKFKKLHSGTEVSLVQKNSAKTVEMLLAKEADLGFLGRHEDVPELTFIPYGCDRQVVIAPNQERYRNLLENGYTLEELLREPFILRELTDDTEEDEDRFLEEHGIDLKTLHVAAKIHDKEIMKRSVSMGMGIAVMPLKAVEEEAQKGNLLIFYLDLEQNERTLYLAFRKEDEGQAVLAQLMSLCIEYNGRERL